MANLVIRYAPSEPFISQEGEREGRERRPKSRGGPDNGVSFSVVGRWIGRRVSRKKSA